MKILDEVQLTLQAGNGGNGAASFRREKFVEFGGPDGGNGGSGGNIYIMVDPTLNTLGFFRKKRFFAAGNGNPGGRVNKTGAAGYDVVLKVPLGTQVFTEDGTHLLFDLDKPSDEIMLAKGGKGGAGNACLKSSINRAPKVAIKGAEGQKIVIWLKLKVLSDVGIIGLPNAGKSTFLSIISSAKPKIGDFAFTTLSPNLGVAKVDIRHEIMFCDIPGLIEGAHNGLGLGDKFLKHIERCKILLHIIDISSPNIIHDFEVIANEILLYSEQLANKPMIIGFSKTDLLSHDEVQEKVDAFIQWLTNSAWNEKTKWFMHIHNISSSKDLNNLVYTFSSYHKKEYQSLIYNIHNILSSLNNS